MRTVHGSVKKNGSRIHERKIPRRREVVDQTSQGQICAESKELDVDVDPIGEGGPTTKEDRHTPKGCGSQAGLLRT